MKKHFSKEEILMALNIRGTLLVIMVCILKSQWHACHFAFTTLGTI